MAGHPPARQLGAWRIRSIPKPWVKPVVDLQRRSRVNFFFTAGQRVRRRRVAVSGSNELTEHRVIGGLRSCDELEDFDAAARAPSLMPPRWSNSLPGSISSRTARDVFEMFLSTTTVQTKPRPPGAANPKPTPAAPTLDIAFTADEALQTRRQHARAIVPDCGTDQQRHRAARQKKCRSPSHHCPRPPGLFQEERPNGHGARSPK